ncbi:hypothetical protein NIES2101_00295 [Calothrix sp. HK-06]|nr:hypothetical protein NIES2101_00295 [Calothrix sp. HK-06]
MINRHSITTIIDSASREPFRALLSSISAEETTLQEKIKVLNEVIIGVELLTEAHENTSTRNHWMSTFASFSTAGTIAAFSAMNPVVGLLACTVSVASAVMTIGCTILENQRTSGIAEKLKKYRLVLKSQTVSDWAAVWEVCGTEIFCDALYEASSGVISYGQLQRQDNRNPLAAALDYIAGVYGVTRDVVIQQVKQIKSGNAATKIFDAPTKLLDAQAPTKIIDVPNVVKHTLVTDSHKAVNDDKYQWVDNVLNMPFRVLTGDPGSGKSTLERWMISMLKEQGYHVVCINTETNPDIWKGVEVLTTPEEINEFFSDFLASIEGRQKECRRLSLDEDDFLEVADKRSGRDGKVAIFFMEANTFEICGVDPELWAAVLKQCLTNIRKWGYTACLTAQSDNQSSISSKLTGFSKRYDEQPRVECIVKTDEKTGRAVSSGRGLLKSKGKNDAGKPIQLMNFPKTKDFRTEAEKTSGVTFVQKTTTPVQDSISNIEQLERMYKLDATGVKTQLSDLAQKVLEIINDSDTGVIKFENLRTSRKWKNKYSMDRPIKSELQNALNELLANESINKVGDDTYECL